MRPAVSAMLGLDYRAPVVKARLASPLRANGRRQDYIRARISYSSGLVVAEPFALQDSSMQKVFAQSDGLIIRKIDAPPAEPGEEVDVLLLDAC
jgi:molybdopterin molybdotransferase